MIGIGVLAVYLAGAFVAQYIARVIREEGKFEIDSLIKIGIYIR